MSDTRERHRAFLLLVLLTRKGQALRQDIKPPPTAEDVGALQSSRLIERDKVNRSHRYTLTDKGWAHVAAHLGDPLPETKFAAGVLRDLLAGLKAYMGRSGAGLADIMGEASPAPAEPSAPPAPDGKETARAHPFGLSRHRRQVQYARALGGPAGRSFGGPGGAGSHAGGHDAPWRGGALWPGLPSRDHRRRRGGGDRGRR